MVVKVGQTDSLLEGVGGASEDTEGILQLRRGPCRLPTGHRSLPEPCLNLGPAAKEAATSECQAVLDTLVDDLS